MSWPWWLTYYRKLVLKKEEVVGVRSIGTRVHAVVAEWYDLQAKGEVPEWEDLMKGKKGLVMGVANDKSIAWGIASQLAAQGAEMAFSYMGESLLRRVQPLADSIGVKHLIECDVSSDAANKITHGLVLLLLLGVAAEVYHVPRGGT